MKFSIIVPIYNVEKYIRKCIDSIINQTYKKIEIILVDDGSPDNCGKICDEYKEKDKRIKVIHKKNGGISDARNKGLEVATGDYVIFIDSDDYVSNKLCEIVNNYIAETNADIIQYNYYKFNDGEKVLNQYNQNIEYNLYDNKYDINYKYLFDETITRECWNKVYKKKLFNDIKYPVDKIAEDLATTYKLINNSNIVCCLQVNLYFYRVRNNSFMTTGSIKLFDNAVEAHYNIYKFYSKNFDEKFKIKAYSNYYNNLMKLVSYEKMNGLSSSIDKLNKINFEELNFKSKIVYVFYKFFPNTLLSIIYNKKVKK